MSRLIRQIRWFIQRGRRGFSDRDVWDLCDYLSRWLPDAIRAQKGCGHPVDFADQESWDSVLEKMARGFEEYRWSADNTNDSERTARAGVALFAKHFGALWT